jgi:phosphoribosylamine---glycine ligase
MHVLLVGGGGREHALAWRLAQSASLTRLSVTHANPGFPSDAVPAGGDPLAYAVSHGVDLVVIGPEAPLADGLVDRLAEAGIPAFGPQQAAASLEASKAFAKSFMDRHGIPTAGWSEHTDAAAARAAVTGRCVIKADGLAAGKGVYVCDDAAEARAAIDEIFAGRFGAAGARVVVEERLTGPEVSILALCDGERAVPLLPARDHKRRFDRDEGPNTGGMGAICPPPDLPEGLVDDVLRTVLQPVVDGMRAEGAPFRGVLYAGLMLTPEGPKVLEFNVRFGDPECQPLMLMLDEDLLSLMHVAATEHLPERPLRWRTGAACCVVMVAGGYPGAVVKGAPISGVPDPSADAVVFYAGAKRSGDAVLSNGGRVLGVTAHGADLESARRNAYALADAVRFETCAVRRDIGGAPIPAP